MCGKNVVTILHVVILLKPKNDKKSYSTLFLLKCRNVYSGNCSQTMNMSSY